MREPAGLAADGAEAARGFNLTGGERRRGEDTIGRLHFIKRVCVTLLPSFMQTAPDGGRDAATLSSRVVLGRSKSEK